MSSKGKEVATSSGKRKRGGGGGFGEDKSSGGGRKRKNREVLQFFEDAAEVDESESESDDSAFDSAEEEFEIEIKVKKEPEKFHNLPVIPKEEEIDEVEFDKMMEERYNAASGFVRYEEDAYDSKRPADRNLELPSSKDPVIWKVKCMVGRERHSVFCLMQKFVDLKSLGTKLQIVSAVSVDHIKGFIFVEANKEIDIYEACKGLSSIYYSRVAPVPRNEVSHLLTVRTKHSEVSEGMWVRVKNGKYKGDLAQIVAVNDTRKKATVKLIPRIDLQALAQKIGGGISMKNAATPAPRLISSSELEVFRSLIQIKRDRDTGKNFEVLDGLMLKDGFLYKKVSVDSLSCWGVMPSEEELLKFKPSDNNESENLEWLTQLYGRPKKKGVIKNDKGGEKGESSSAFGLTSFELYELVCFGRKDFGLVVGMEKDDSYKILKEGMEGPVVVTLGLHDLKNGPSDMKFTALDRWKKTISINDTVMVLEGPLKDRQGLVKQIYRGIVFIYDQDETENGGYVCSKAQLCEKIKLSVDMCGEKGSGSGFGDFPSSPKSPRSPPRPWQATETSCNFNRGEKDGMFSIGQTLRIRVGPLKGYLCRVLAVRRYDVTVKLDSQQKVLTVKCENLSELRVKPSAMPLKEEPGSSSFKPFNVLGTEGISGGWTDGPGASTAGSGWNAAGLSAERMSWPSFPASGPTSEADPENLSISVDAELRKEDGAWEKKVTTNWNSSWDAAAAGNKAVADDQVGGWGKKEDSWNKAVTNVGSGSRSSDGWGKAASQIDAAGGSWLKGKNIIGNSTSGCGNATMEQLDSWGKGKGVVKAASWEKNGSSHAEESDWTNKGSRWNQQKSQNEGGWEKAAEGQNKGTVQEDSWDKAAENSGSQDNWSGIKAEWQNLMPVTGKQIEGWGNASGSCVQPEACGTDNSGGWMKAKVESASETANENDKKNSREDATGWAKDSSNNPSQDDGWNKSKAFGADGGSWNKQQGGSSWGDGKNTSEDATDWTKGGSSNQNQDDGWNKPKVFGAYQGSWSKQQGESSWGKKEGGVSWGRQEGGVSWGRQEGGSAWSRKDGGSWNKQDRDQDHGSENKAFDGGRGSGRRRGGGHWGVRNEFGRGRSFGKDQSSGWNNEQAEQQDGERVFGANESLEGQNAGGCWNGFKAADGSWSSRWNKESAVIEEPSGGWGAGSKWDTWKSSGDDGVGWKGGASGVGARQSNWGAQKASKQDEPSSWGGKAVDPDDKQPTGWGSQSSQGKCSWNLKSTEIKNASQSGSHGYGRDGGKTTDGSSNGWDQSAGRNQESCWGKKSDWCSSSGNASGEQDSDQYKNGNWNSGSSDAGNQNSGWGKKSSWSSSLGSSWKGGSNDAGGNHDSAWGNKGNWNSLSGDANQDSSWPKKSSWSSGHTDADQDSHGASHSEDQSKDFSNRGGSGSWRGGFGGRGNSERGGFRGRGDRGGFGGRNGSDRGGYGGRGRGRSDRGGFAGRGRFGSRGGSDGGGYDGSRGGYSGRGSGRGGYSSRWKDNNDSGEERACDWKNSGGGWKSDDAGGSSSQGQWKSWNSANAGTSSWGNNGEGGSSKGGWN